MSQSSQAVCLTATGDAIPQQGHLILYTNVNLGWQKLDHYYLLTDRAPLQ